MWLSESEMTLSGEALNSYDRKAYSELEQHVPTLSPSVYPLNPIQFY